MLTIDFYTQFAKKYNSTKQPTGITPSLSIQGYLREPCSIMSPVIRIERIANDANPEKYIYAFVQTFNRFYFITDWVWAEGVWEVHMDVDVLGSWRTYIGGQTEYILRTDSDTTDFNGAITDKMYPATTDFNVTQTALQTPFVQNISQGCYIVGIINGYNTSGGVGAITYYAMTNLELGNLKYILFSDDGLKVMGILDNLGNLNIDDMSEEVFKTMYNPFQYIASCYWFPIAVSDIAGSNVTTINIGWWPYSLTGKAISQNVGSFFDGVSQLPVHPQSATRGKYLNYAPYTKITMYGKFGSMPLDPSVLEIGDYIINNYLVDYISGECVFRTYKADNSAGTGRKLIAQTQFMIGVPIQLAQIGRDYLGTAVQAIDAVKSAGMGAFMGAIVGGPAGAVAGGLISGAHGIYDTIDTSMPQMQTSGVNGSFAGAEINTTITIINFIITDEDITHKGRPLCESRLISSLTGFVQCAEGDIDIPCLLEEKNRIASFLVNGFFWE